MGLPKRILVLGLPKDYPDGFGRLCADVEFAISATPQGAVSVVRDSEGGPVPRTPTLRELVSAQVVTPADVARLLSEDAPEEQRPQPRFETGDRIVPNAASIIRPRPRGVGEIVDQNFCGDCGSYHYVVRFPTGIVQMFEDRMEPTEKPRSYPFPNRIIVTAPPSEYPRQLIGTRCELTIVRRENGAHEVIEEAGEPIDGRPATPEEIGSCRVLDPQLARELVAVEDRAQDASPRDDGEQAPDGWQGTQPAEGTRRATILDAIRSCPDGAPMSTLDLADRIESALLDSTIAAEAEEEDEVWDVALDPEGNPYVSLESLIDQLREIARETRDQDGNGAFEKVENEDAGRAVHMLGGRSGGKREAMRQVIRENAATEEDAEAVLDALQKTGRAFMLDGKAVAEESPEPPKVVYDEEPADEAPENVEDPEEPKPSLFDVLFGKKGGRR